MSRLQEAVNKFAAEWLAAKGEKPPQDTLYDGTFCRQSGQPFCLCAALIDFTGLTCAASRKPVTAESYEWMDEARAERAARTPDRVVAQGREEPASCADRPDRRPEESGTRD